MGSVRALLHIFDEQLLPRADVQEPRLVSTGQKSKSAGHPPGVRRASAGRALLTEKAAWAAPGSQRAAPGSQRAAPLRAHSRRHRPLAECGAGRKRLASAHLRAFPGVLRRDLRAGTVLRASRMQLLDSPAHPSPSEKKTDPIEQVAHCCYLSRSQLTKLFRQRTGQSFREYPSECRVKEAKLLLRESTWSTRRIARHVGLRSTSYFSQLLTRVL
jgi:AraC-like DNA-binding protein